MTDAAALAVTVRAFVDELARAGVREAVVCPGSRSTPLALALRAHGAIAVQVLLDERSAAFYALGMARTAGRPVVLAVTSGTAAAECLPAVVEASLARVPLLVLTADRPPELRDRGAPQTIDQVRLYGSHAKWFAELPLPDRASETLAHWRSTAGRAVATAAAGPRGAFHLDLDFREPLIPVGGLGAFAEGPTDDAPKGSAGARPFAAAVGGRRRLSPEQVAALAERLAAHPRGLIVAGPDDDPLLPAALATLARATGFPILADPLSGLRTGAHDRSLVIARGDQIVRPGRWIDLHRPTLVLRTGAMPTSKPLTELLRTSEPGLIVLDGDGGWREAALLAATFVHADPASTATDLAAALARLPVRRGAGAPPSGDPAPPSAGDPTALAPGDPTALAPGDPAWVADWLAADAAAGVAMESWLAALDEPYEGAPFPALAASLPDGAVLWAGSSMPVRDLDAWLPSTDRSLRVLASRGANGIDGVLSAALGSAAVADGPVALVVGDLSFLHDLGGLVTARLAGSDLLVVLVDNDGGGIFSFLPQASADAPEVGLPEHFEELFGTPHGIDLGPVVESLGGTFWRVDAMSLRPAVEAAVDRPGLRVLHLRTERQRNVELHRSVAAAVAAALESLSGEGIGMAGPAEPS